MIWLADLFFLDALQVTEISSAASGDDLFHQFHVLNTLLGSNRGFLHQLFTLDAEHGILVHKFLDDDAHPLQQGSGLLRLLRPSGDHRPQLVALGPELFK